MMRSTFERLHIRHILKILVDSTKKLLVNTKVAQECKGASATYLERGFGDG